MSESEGMMATIMPGHDRSKPLAKFNAELEETDFWDAFPPEGAEARRAG